MKLSRVLLLISFSQVAAVETNFMDAPYFRFPYGFDAERSLALHDHEIEQKQTQQNEQKHQVQHTRRVENVAFLKDDADVAGEALFHAVENVEKRVENALRDEVDLLFGHPGSVHREDTTDSQMVTKVQEDIKKEKNKVNKKARETGAKASKKGKEVLSAAAVREQEMRACLEDMFRGGIDE